MSSGYLDAEIGPSALCAAGRQSARSRPRIFLLSDVRLYREGLLWSLSRQDAFDVIGADDCSVRTLTYLVELNPEIVILDVGAAEAFATANTLSSRLPITKIIAFAVSEVADVVLACAEAGIAGYVAPNGSASDLISAIEFALRDELYCSPRIAHLLSRRIGTLSARLAGSIEPQMLTQRERQILGLVSEGKSNKEIGRALRISNATVKNHVHNILEKLQVQRRGEAAAWLRAAAAPLAAAARRPRIPVTLS
ncbi:MAG: response regulator transcription factor [Alphaproteobacteria bacterium]|nr:response regulator transcription factor [Alphaproteobacteria bacterium]MBV9201161.1 response regulator transcription factor [Alphaproteobacteria bacterium]MBV9377921.1 response regulator transcription factor [Alphaproteobacteria bacterium]